MDKPKADIRHILIDYLARQEPGTSLSEWITGMGIEIRELEKSPRRGTLLLRSEYRPNPPTILIYQDVIEMWHTKLVEEMGLTGIEESLLKELCLVHELLHDLFVRAKTHFPRQEARLIRKISLRQEEFLVREIVRDWMKSRYPQYNDPLNQILDIH